jgi:preprotein translocase subunit SecA
MAHMSLLTKVFGDPNAKVIKKLQTDAAAISAREPAIALLTDADLAAKTNEFKQKIASGTALDALMPEAFAVVREAAKRVLGQRHYDVQLMGGLVLHRGGIAEMRTGEGKTLTATTATYLNALSGRGVHVITVNDYLAKRDAAWMGRVFHFLGLSVGVIQHESGYVFDPSIKEENISVEAAGVKAQSGMLRAVSRREAYAADITYGTNNEFGFDYLRDNMAQRPEDMVQRGLHYAIVDEVDSILIDEARTPLIISAPAQESADLYAKFAGLVVDLSPGEHYKLDEKLKTATFTEQGLQKLETLLNVSNLYESGLDLIHHAEVALKAQALFKKDRDYVVRDGEVVIVDEFTGRLMVGRRYSDGLHQAIEAKEGVKVQRESRTLATITFQNYFRLYTKLSGMTGTAATEAEELSKIYKLEVTQIPPNKPNRRQDLSDRIYKTEKGRWMAVVKEVQARHAAGQPVLIGTTSIDKNELLSQLLNAAGVPHKMLNAKNHEQEGEIIAQAGRRGAVTLATNMAGRGVDIILGGNPVEEQEAEAVRALGGLFVIGTARHESRRIDNQLRGRAGRQGDPGTTQFFVSLDDDLMRIFGSERIKGMMNTLGLEEDVPIESKMVTRAMTKAQERVEGHNFDIRKHVLEYDDVLNKHRTAVYAERLRLLIGKEDIVPQVREMLLSEVERVVLFHTTPQQSHEVPDHLREANAATVATDVNIMLETLCNIVPMSGEEKTRVQNVLNPLSRDEHERSEQQEKAIVAVMEAVDGCLNKTSAEPGQAEETRGYIRQLMLRAIDGAWMRHLDDMTYLRRSIGLQGYAQRDPLVEYKKESFRLYTTMRQDVVREVAYNVCKMIDQVVTAKALLSALPKISNALANKGESHLG